MNEEDYGLHKVI